MNTWELETGGWPLVVNRTSDGRVVAIIQCVESTGNELHCSEADAVKAAALIAAAPELLAALQRLEVEAMLDESDWGDSHIVEAKAMARAAIAKAGA